MLDDVKGACDPKGSVDERKTGRIGGGQKVEMLIEAKMEGVESKVCGYQGSEFR